MTTTIWFAPLILSLVALAVVGGILFARAWPRKPDFSAEEREEMANAPMTPLQKRAWISLAIGVLTAAITTALVATNGAAEYWDNDNLRLTVVGVFLAGLVLNTTVLTSSVFPSAGRKNLDERDRAILSRAPNVTTAAVLLTLAGWMIYLAEKFRPEGAVPVVYLYLIFGSVIMIDFIARPIGVLLGYWMVVRRAES